MTPGIALKPGSIVVPIAHLPAYAKADILANGDTMMDFYAIDDQGKRFEGVALFRRFATEARSDAATLDHITDEVRLVRIGVPDVGIHADLSPKAMAPGDWWEVDLRIETATEWDFSILVDGPG